MDLLQPLRQNDLRVWKGRHQLQSDVEHEAAARPSLDPHDGLPKPLSNGTFKAPQIVHGKHKKAP